MSYYPKDLLGTEFILEFGVGHYSNYVNSICIIQLNSKNNNYEMTLKNSNTSRCYSLSEDSKIYALTKETHPEYFL